MKYTIRALLNDGEGRFWEYRREDRLVPGPEMVLEAETVDEALNLAWEIGNRMGSRPGAAWPHDIRSMSAGDVLAVFAGDDPNGLGAGFHAVARAGFEPASRIAVLGSLVFGRTAVGGQGIWVTCEEPSRRLASQGRI